MSLKNPTLVMWIPNSFGIWSNTITSPTPVLKPVSTGDEMKLETKPRRITRAISSATPTNAPSVAVAVTSFAGSPSGTTSPSWVPARIASVPVELTLRTRDEPSSA